MLIDRRRADTGSLKRCRRKLFGQFVPAKLFGQAVGLSPRHIAPIIDRTRGTRRYTSHAVIALFSIHDIVSIVVGDGTHGACRLAGITANTNDRVDHMLLKKAAFCHFHGESSLHAKIVLWLTKPDLVPYQEQRARSVKANVVKVDRLTVDAHDWWCNPVGEFTWLDTTSH